MTIALLGGLIVAVVLATELSVAAAARARAQTAADAAALAGAVGGRGDAADLARRNGGQLTAWRRHGDRVDVTVVVRRARADAAAQGRWEWVATRSGP